MEIIGLPSYLIVFLIGLIVAFLITPLVEKLAVKIGAVDIPTERKVHAEPIPSLGGVAIYLSFLLALFFALIKFFPNEREINGILLGGTVILLFGIADDIKDLSPKVKFIGQILAATTLVVFGVQMEFIGNPLGGLIDLGIWGVPATLLWVVALSNIINFIDGLDGLAAGVSSIAAIALFVSAFETGQTTIAFLTVALAGATIGFLTHNFNPARIFMGDSGSMFLGFMLGAITVHGVMKSVAIVSLLIPIVVMGVPIFDASLAILRRLKDKKPLTQADKGHIHHQLLHRGFSHRQSVVIIYLWSILLSASAALLLYVSAAQRLPIFTGLTLLSFFFARRLGLFDSFRKK